MAQETIRLDTMGNGNSGFPWRLTIALVVAIGLAGGAGYYAWTLRAKQQRTAEELERAQVEAAMLGDERARNAELNQAIAACETERDTEKQRCAEAAEAVEAMRADLDATRTELEEVRKQRTEAAKRIAAFKDLTAKFQKMIDAGRLDVVVRDGRMLVKLPASVLFESGSAELSRDGELALMEVAVVLREFGDRKFMVVGHTDDRPLESAETSRYRNNWELSTARAVTVVSFLIEAKMKPENLVAAGLGAHDPIANNKTAKGRQENRRIELVLLPNLDELPAMPEDPEAAEPK